MSKELEEANRPEPIEEWGDESVKTIGPSLDEEQVVPVRIVESGRSREIRAHRDWNHVIPAAAAANTDGEIQEVVGGNEDRRRLYIFNASVVDADADAFLSPPNQTAPSTADVGGTLPASTTYRAIITAVNANGETTGSNEQSITTGAGTATNTVTFNWDAVAGATEYRIYMTAANGATGTEAFLTSVPAGTLTYTRQGVPGTQARYPPTTNTAFLFTVTGTTRTIWILDNEAASPFMGYPLPPGEGLEFYSENAVYAVMRNNAFGVLSVHEEFSIPEL